MNKDWCFEPLKKYGGYVQTWEEYEEVKQIIEENLHKEKSTDKIEVLTRWQDPTIEEMKKEIEKLTAESTEWESKCYKYQDIINELEKDIDLELYKTRASDEYNNGLFNAFRYVKDKLKELKEDK